MSRKKQKSTGTPKLLTKRQVERLNAANKVYVEKLQRERPVYPDQPYDQFLQSLATDTSVLSRLGWQQHNLFEQADRFPIEDFRYEGAYRRGRKGKAGNRGRGDRNKDAKVLLNPELVRRLVEQKILQSGLKPVGNTGVVKRAVWNFEFLTEGKANWFLESYALIIPLAHIWSCCEVGKEGIEAIARRTGYQVYTSSDNSRGNQAVSLLIHPRFKILNNWIVQEVANVQGIHDLRPLLGVDLKDTSEPDEEWAKSWAAVHHAKSMRGGVQTTASIRWQQNRIIANFTRGKGRGAVGGDFNTIIGTPAGESDIRPLLDAGFELVDPQDTRATQVQGSRLDALFTLEFDEHLHIRGLLDWFNIHEIGRGLTDHSSVVFE